MEGRGKRTVNANDVYERTPLHLAAQQGHDELVELFLKRGAKIDRWEGTGDRVRARDPVSFWRENVIAIIRHQFNYKNALLAKHVIDTNIQSIILLSWKSLTIFNRNTSSKLDVQKEHTSAFLLKMCGKGQFAAISKTTFVISFTWKYTKRFLYSFNYKPKLIK